MTDFVLCGKFEKILYLKKCKHLEIIFVFLLLQIHQYDIINSCVCSYKKTVFNVLVFK